MDHPRQPSRRVGERRVGSGQRHGRGDGRGARDRRAGEDRLDAAAHASSSPAGTARSRGCSARPSGSSITPTELAAQGGRLRQLRQQRRAASSASAARTALERFANELARDVADPKKGVSIGERRLAATILQGTARGSGRWRASRRLFADRRARLGLRLHAVPAAPRHRLAQHRLRRRGRLRAVPLDLRLDRSLRALHGSRLRLRRRAGQGRRPRGAAPRPRRICCRSSSAAGGARARATSTRSRSWPTRCAPRRSSTTGASTIGVFEAVASPYETAGGAEEEGRGPGVRLRAAEERGRAAAGGGAPLRRGVGRGAARAARRCQPRALAAGQRRAAHSRSAR